MSDFNRNLIDDLRAHQRPGLERAVRRPPGGHPHDHRREDRPAARDPARLLARRRPDRSSSPPRAARRPTGLVPQHRGQPARDGRDRRRALRRHGAHVVRPDRAPAPVRPARRDPPELPGLRAQDRSRVIPVIVLEREARQRLPDATLRGWQMTRSSIRRPTADELADIALDARRQPGGLGRGRRTLRGLVRRSRRADPVGRDQPVRGRDAS